MSPELNPKLIPKLNPKRRCLLYAGLAAGLGAAGLWWLWPEQGIANPCRAALPPHFADHEVVQAAWSGIDAALFYALRSKRIAFLPYGRNE